MPIPLIAAGVTVAGGLLVACLAHLWNTKRDKVARFTTAAAGFRAAFTPELAALETGTYPESDPMDGLRAAHDERHAVAVKAFEPYLAVQRLASFRKDWFRYCYGEREDGEPHTPETALMSHDDLLCLEYTREHHLGNPERARKLAIVRINKLLTYARHP